MDEPTAGVDTASQQVLSQVLARLAARGTTMVIVTHELAALQGIVGRILLVSAGRLAFDGTPADFAREQSAYALAHDGHHHDEGGPRSTGRRRWRRPPVAARPPGGVPCLSCSPTTSCSGPCWPRCSSASPPPWSGSSWCSAGWPSSVTAWGTSRWPVWRSVCSPAPRPC